MFQNVNDSAKDCITINMNPQDIANVCVKNNGFRFDAISKWMRSFPGYWNINDYVVFKHPKTGRNIQTTCLVAASEYSDSYFVEELLRLGASTEVFDFNDENHQKITIDCWNMSQGVGLFQLW